MEKSYFLLSIAFLFRLLIMFSVVVSLAKQWAFEEPYVETITSENVLTWPHVVGKSLLIKSLVKHYTKHNLPDVRGLITIISGRCSLQFVECPNDINGMIDAAKFDDLTLLLIDGSYGFEMFLRGSGLQRTQHLDKGT
ncbi:hypothetical protein AAZX31_05G075800 [Glycine max]